MSSLSYKQGDAFSITHDPNYESSYLQLNANQTETSVVFIFLNWGSQLFLTLGISSLIWSIFNQDCFHSIIMHNISLLILMLKQWIYGRTQKALSAMHKRWQSS